MRATDLGFRSPKERTPAAYSPQVTHDGRSLAYRSRQIPGGKIGTERRFAYYSKDRTGYSVGPGSYEPPKLPTTRTTVVYRPLHRLQKTTCNAYYMVGNHLIYDSYWEKHGKEREHFPSRPEVKTAFSRTIACDSDFPMRPSSPLDPPKRLVFRKTVRGSV